MQALRLTAQGYAKLMTGGREILLSDPPPKKVPASLFEGLPEAIHELSSRLQGLDLRCTLAGPRAQARLSAFDIPFCGPPAPQAKTTS